MREFKWIDWNLAKIAAHALGAEDVEAAFDRIFHIHRRRDDSFEMHAATPSGRRVVVIWRYDREDQDAPDVLDATDNPPIFVITAF